MPVHSNFLERIWGNGIYSTMRLPRSLAASQSMLIASNNRDKPTYIGIVSSCGSTLATYLYFANFSQEGVTSNYGQWTVAWGPFYAIILRGHRLYCSSDADQLWTVVTYDPEEENT